jgi:hypothetical protein
MDFIDFPYYIQIDKLGSRLISHGQDQMKEKKNKR